MRLNSETEHYFAIFVKHNHKTKGFDNYYRPTQSSE